MLTAKDIQRAIEIEERSIVAVKCFACNEMISAYGFAEHKYALC